MTERNCQAHITIHRFFVFFIFSGLDPADPNFQHLPFVIRLDPADAQFVDVIHTDGRDFANTVGFGLAQQSGHIDFYVNGGENQKGCEDGIKGLIGGILKAVRG